MKLLQLILLALISLFVVHNSNAQTAVGGCSTVTLTSVPSYPTNLIVVGSFNCFECNGQCIDVLATSAPQFSKSRSWLMKKLPTGLLAVVQGGTNGIVGDNVVFNVSEHGTYRIRNQRPKLLTTITCPNGRNVHNILMQLVGKSGFFDAPFLDATFSNEVVVGPAVQSDIVWNFIDANANNLFSPGEQIKMNTTGTKNYDAWWLAIFENGGANRYWSNGWTQGQIPSQINLTTLSNPVFGGTFAQIPVSYTVQFAISASCNTSWTNLDRNFSVCPAGLGCRAAAGEEVALYPSPANNTFHLVNLDISSEQQQRVILTDVTGRAVKSFTQIAQPEFDISDVPNGMYIVSVWEGEHRVFSTKLSVIK